MSRRFAEDVEFDRREYRNGPRTAYYDDDVRSTRSTRAPDPRRSQPDFLRDDYGRSTAGPMVLRGRDDFDDRRSSHRGGGGDKEEIIFRERVDRGPPPPPEIDREEIIFRRGEGARSAAPTVPPPKSTRSVYEERDEVISRRDDRSRAPPRTEYDREEITFRRGEGDRRSTRDVERDEFIVRRSETERPKPPSHDRDEFIFRRSDRESHGRDVEKDEFIFRHDDRNGRPGDREEDKIIFKRTERDDDVRSTRSRGASRADIEKDTYISSRTRERSLPPPRREKSLPPPQLAFREREDFVIRRREPSPPRIDREEIVFRHRRPSSPPSAPPPPPQRDEREEITIRRREGPGPARSHRGSPPRSPSPQNREEEIIIRRGERSPSPVPPPVPPPPMEPIIRPPIHQEIITHHRHIDHGFERPRSPTPPPEPPSPPREDHLEIAIRRKDGSQYHEENIHIDRGGPAPGSDDGHESHHTRGRSRSLSMTTRRSPSAASRHSRHPTTVVSRRDPMDDLEAEADFYNRRAVDRSYPGEAYNGATKEWAIVDVPPGTERVRMDGIGGGSQEITWQRYNGVRRSKFLTDGQEFPGPFSRPQIGHVGTPKSSKLPPDMWTEITKDLVLKEAIDQAGYDYEETDFFYYVMEYLKYEDVLQLVEISDNIRRDRRQRIREIEWERNQLDRDRKSKGNYDEHVYEREIIYDRGGGRRYR